MKFRAILLPLLLATCVSASAQTLLWSDNFNTADTNNFDGAPLDGRLDGLAAGDTALQSFNSQQIISNQALQLNNGGQGGVRFGPQTSRYDWAGTTTGDSILAAGGFKVSFDWTMDFNGTEWVAWKVGTPNDDSALNASNVDYSILLRQNGGNERWDNGANLGDSGTPFLPTIGVAHHIEFAYSFNSFDDGTIVNLAAFVDGTQILSDSFEWDGNAGALHMELQTDSIGNHIDNLAITTVPEPSTLALLGIPGLGLGLALVRRRMKSQKFSSAFLL